MLLSNGKLVDKIRKLQDDRREHLEALERIDRVLSEISSVLTTGSATGQVGGSQHGVADLDLGATSGARRRGRFSQTAQASVIQFLATHQQPSTADLNAHWREEGRKGTVNVTLFKLIREGVIKRIEDENVRGSRYALIGSVA